MGADLLVVLAALAFPLSQPDTSSAFATPATQELVERAMARRAVHDSSVNDYAATLRYRLTVSVGRRRWARGPAAGVEEQEARIHWQLPNDLRVDIIGRRFRGRVDGLELSSVFDRPWFVPRTVDDSVRIFSNDFPATGALHPLAAGGPQWYRYEITDSLSMIRPDGQRLRLLAVEVIPQRVGPALIAGRIWLDAETADVVRLTFRYVGTALWVRPDRGTGRDSSSARRVNSLVNRVLSLDADLEYAIQDGFWMPYRQTVSGRVDIPLVSDLVIPFEAVTTFRDYAINTRRPVVFAMPLPDSGLLDASRWRSRHDSLEAERRSGGVRARQRAWNYADRWPGGRYELHRPSNDSLARYRGWTDSLAMKENADEAARRRDAVAELAGLSEDLPDVLTGRHSHSFGFERITDALQYNRVQGLSVGLGYDVRAPGRFADVYATARYGFSDKRVTGRLSYVRDAPAGRLVVSGYHDLADVDPFSLGRNLANSANALFTAHDDADYAVVDGGSAGYETSLAIGLDLHVQLRGERQRTVVRRARSGVNDLLGGSGDFPEVTPVREGTFGGATAGVEGYGKIRWSLTADGLVGAGTSTVRGFGALTTAVGGERGLTLRLQGGVASAPTLPQLAFRAGGLKSVRGFDYGTQLGQAFWSAQLDVTPVGGSFRPVFFVDAGRAGRPADLFSNNVLLGGGIGLSVFSRLLRTSLVRFDLSHAISPDPGNGFRFDLVFQGVR